MSSLWRRDASLPTPGSRFGAATVLLTLLAALADALAAPPEATIALLALTQTTAVAWYALRALDPHRSWATAGCVLAGGWTLTFLVPTWIYVFDPGLAAGLPVADAIAISTIALLSLLAGSELAGMIWPSLRVPAPARVELRPVALSRRRAVGWIIVGAAAMGLLFALNGGPVAWITNLDKVGSMAAGLTYVIGVALVMQHTAVVIYAHRLIRLGRLDGRGLLLVAGAMLVLLPLGARLFVAIALVEVLLLYAVIVRPIALRMLVPAGALCALLLIFGYGTVKRYQTFRAANPVLDRGFADYARHRAVDELAAAYANNYADGVLLTAQARAVIPAAASYEYGEAFLRLALHPIPSPVRPKLARAPALDRYLGAVGGNSHAVPLDAEGYVQFGVPGVFAMFLAVGAAIAVLDRALRRPTISPPALVTLAAISAQLPFVMRTGIPLGVAVAGLQVIGIYAVARTVMRS